MENLNAERIKSDLERCKFGKDKPNCEGCNYKPWIKPRCWHLLCHDALALINSQEQRIKELTEENESLKTQRRVLAVGLKDLRKEIKAIKADTVRKMQERIKEEKFHHTAFGDLVLYADIDQIAKEMLEEKK